MLQIRRKAGKLFFFTAVTALLLAVSAFAAEENMAVAVGATTGSSLRLRSEPNTTSSIVTMMDKSVAVAVLDGSVDGWYKINYAGSVGYVSSDFMILDQDNKFESYGRINTTSVNARSGASTDDAIVAVLNTNAIVSVNCLSNGWYGVTLEDGTPAFIRSDFVDLVNSATPTASANASSVVALADSFRGVRYSYGGASPSGFDCSGFTMYIFSKFGYSLPHSATSQWQSGLGTKVYDIGSLQSGDLVFFNDPSRNAGKACSHVGIYVGNGQIIHSSSSRNQGVVISDLTSGYYNTYFVGGIHL